MNVARIGDSAMTVKSSLLFKRFGTQLLFSLPRDCNRLLWVELGRRGGWRKGIVVHHHRGGFLSRFIFKFIQKATVGRWNVVVFVSKCLILKLHFYNDANAYFNSYSSHLHTAHTFCISEGLFSVDERIVLMQLQLRPKTTGLRPLEGS